MLRIGDTVARWKMKQETFVSRSKRPDADKRPFTYRRFFLPEEAGSYGGDLVPVQPVQLRPGDLMHKHQETWMYTRDKTWQRAASDVMATLETCPVDDPVWSKFCLSNSSRKDTRYPRWTTYNSRASVVSKRSKETDDVDASSEAETRVVQAVKQRKRGHPRDPDQQPYKPIGICQAGPSNTGIGDRVSKKRRHSDASSSSSEDELGGVPMEALDEMLAKEDEALTKLATKCARDEKKAVLYERRRERADMEEKRKKLKRELRQHDRQ